MAADWMLTIGETSISDFGECYEKLHGSYIFGQKRMGRPLCYRCVTPIIRTRNVIQLAHQDGTETTAIKASKKPGKHVLIRIRYDHWRELSFFGLYRTPKELQTDDCYALEVDCSGKRDNLRLKAYHCASGTVFDARSYQCLGSWYRHSEGHQMPSNQRQKKMGKNEEEPEREEQEMKKSLNNSPYQINRTHPCPDSSHRLPPLSLS
ncbi:unnamed protein product, partial [Mesorhabditis spiculigera]